MHAFPGLVFKRAELAGRADQILVDRLFFPVFGSSSEIDMNVIYVPCSSLSCGVSELQAIVDSGEAQVAFHIQSISVFEIMRLADADVMLPPKLG